MITESSLIVLFTWIFFLECRSRVESVASPFNGTHLHQRVPNVCLREQPQGAEEYWCASAGDGEEEALYYHAGFEGL